MAILTNDEISAKVRARESFWVGTENERKAASAAAKANGIKYTTGKDDRGGYYCVHPSVRIPKPSKLKAAVAILLLAASLHAADNWAALSQIESDDCDTCTGSSGEVGRWQQLPRYWRLYTSLPLSAATNPFTALAVAKLDMVDRVKNFVAHNHRQPTDGEFVLLWHSPTRDVLRPNKEEKLYEQRFLNLLNSK
jgi:hypothetical protein